MEAIQTHYFNSTIGTVILKAKNGEKFEVKPGTGKKSEMMNPFVKIKYPGTGWRKFGYLNRGSK
jgi:hypothetical protein